MSDSVAGDGASGVEDPGASGDAGRVVVAGGSAGRTGGVQDAHAVSGADEEQPPPLEAPPPAVWEVGAITGYRMGALDEHDSGGLVEETFLVQWKDGRGVVHHDKMCEPRRNVEGPRLDQYLARRTVMVRTAQLREEFAGRVCGLDVQYPPGDPGAGSGVEGAAMGEVTTTVVAADPEPASPGADADPVPGLQANLARLRTPPVWHEADTGQDGEVVVPCVDAPLLRERHRISCAVERLAQAQRPAPDERGVVKQLERRIALLSVVQAAHHREVIRVPHNVADAEADARHWPFWKAAMDTEMASMHKFEVWDLGELPAGKNLMTCKWVFALKRDKEGKVVRYKARLTARGFTQQAGVDFEETWAPTARMRCFRAMLAEASGDASVQTRQWDVTCAFLHADVDVPMYMAQAPGYEVSGGQVCVLRKAIYGCRQASRLFHHEIRTTLLAQGAVQAEADECLFILKDTDGWMRVLCHVDDFAVTFTSQALYDRVFAGMQARFEITDYDGLPMDKFLGVCVERRADATVHMHQKPYIDDLLERLNMTGVAAAKSPASPGTGARLRRRELSEADRELMAAVPYKEAVGALFYLARCTRVDIAHACSQVAMFMADPAPEHWEAVCRIYRYLKGTSHVGLTMTPGEGASSCMGDRPVSDFLQGYCDSDWAGCPMTRKSYTGWLVKVGGGLVAWYSKRQGCIAQSSTEAEYVAAAALGNEMVWWRRLLEDLGYVQGGPVTIWCDNRSTNRLAEHPGRFEATKHIELRYHVLRDYQERGVIKMRWTSTWTQLADILTKNGDVKRFRRVVAEIMGECLG